MMLSQQFAAYSEWRTQLSESLEKFRKWLSENELSDAQFFKFNQLPESPFKGSITYAMIQHVMHGTPVADDSKEWL